MCIIEPLVCLCVSKGVHDMFGKYMVFDALFMLIFIACICCSCLRMPSVLIHVGCADADGFF